MSEELVILALLPRLCDSRESFFRAQCPVKFQKELGVEVPAIFREYGICNSIDESPVGREIFFDAECCDSKEEN